MEFCMKLFVAAFLLVVSSASYALDAVTTGELYQLRATVCISQKSTMEIWAVDTVAKANELFTAAQDCDNVDITFRVGRVLQSKMLDGQQYSLVEINHPTDSTKKLYWFTTMVVTASVKKPNTPPSTLIRKPQKLFQI